MCSLSSTLYDNELMTLDHLLDLIRFLYIYSACSYRLTFVSVIDNFLIPRRMMRMRGIPCVQGREAKKVVIKNGGNEGGNTREVLQQAGGANAV